jgi:transposase InsO family protein
LDQAAGAADAPREARPIAIEAVTATGETSALCQSVGVARASLYRRRQPVRAAVPASTLRPSPRALIRAERQAILDALHSDRFVDQSSARVHATLLEEQTYLGSVRTMYRVLADAAEVRERRDQARHPSYAKPELVATAPNQIWSWDITKLKGPDEVRVLLALCHPRPLQSVRGGLDGRGARERPPGRAAH